MNILTIEIRRAPFDFRDELYGVYQKNSINVEFNTADVIAVAIGKELRLSKYYGTDYLSDNESLLNIALIERLEEIK